MFSVLAGIAVFMRFYCHTRVISSKIAVDDWLMLGAFILTLSLGIMLIVGMSELKESRMCTLGESGAVQVVFAANQLSQAGHYMLWPNRRQKDGQKRIMSG